MFNGEEVLFRVALKVRSACPCQNSIRRLRNEKLILKSSSEVENQACGAGFGLEARRFKNAGF
jgi:hypothetical protein